MSCGVFRPYFRLPPPTHQPIIGPATLAPAPAEAIAIVNNVNTTVYNVGGGVYQIEKTGGSGAAYDGDAVSSVGATGGFVLRLRHIRNGGTVNAWIAGVNSDPLTDSHYLSIDYSWLYDEGAGTWGIYESGGAVVGAGASEYAWIWRTGTTLGYGVGSTLAAAQASPTRTVPGVSGTLYFDSSLYSTSKFEAKFYTAALNAYSLTASPGNYALNGSAVSFVRKYTLVAGSGGYVLTGSAMTPRVTMPAASGAYVLTGSAMTPRVTMPAASIPYALTGSPVTLAKGFRMVAASGAYVLTGSAIGTPVMRRLTALSGAYTLTGSQMTPRVSMPAASIPYTLTGKAASLPLTRRLVAASGAYALNGTAVNFLKGRNLQALSTNYALTGKAVTFSRALRLSAVSAAYLLTGTAAGLLKGRNMPAASGAYALAGSNAAFAVTHILSAQPGNYALSGSAANFIRGRSLVAESGFYNYYGSPVTLTLVRTVLFHDTAPALAGVESSPLPSLANVTPVASVGVTPSLTLADAIPPPAAFTIRTAPSAVELED